MIIPIFLAVTFLITTSCSTTYNPDLKPIDKEERQAIHTDRVR